MEESFPAPPNTVEERAIIRKLMDAPMEEGSTWYLVNFKWCALVHFSTNRASYTSPPLGDASSHALSGSL